MFVIIKSGPDTSESRQAIDLAATVRADLCLVQNGVYFSLQGRLPGFSGTAYALQEDLKLRGLEPGGGVRVIDYAQMVDLMAESDKVVGMF